MDVTFQKSKTNVLLLENISPTAQRIFQTEGFPVESLPGSVPHELLKEKIKDISVLGIRSKTIIDAEILENAQNLMAIGAFCIGTNQIDLKACSQKGIAVFNAPFSNTRSVVELAIGEIIMLFRNVFDKNQKLHDGIWDKSSKNSYSFLGTGF